MDTGKNFHARNERIKCSLYRLTRDGMERRKKPSENHDTEEKKNKKNHIKGELKGRLCIKMPGSRVKI